MSPQVTAAWIAAGVSAATLVGTLLTAYFSRRATRGDLEKQRKQLDRTLDEQRTRTLNERFATAADRLGNDKPAAVQLATFSTSLSARFTLASTPAHPTAGEVRAPRPSFRPAGEW